MTIQTVIEKAIKGGYTRIEKYRIIHHDGSWMTEVIVTADDEGEIVQRDFSCYLLDPEFWRALGKSMGWKKENTGDLSGDKELIRGNYRPFRMDEWEWQWHEMLFHLAESKSIESYFETL